MCAPRYLMTIALGAIGIKSVLGSKHAVRQLHFLCAQEFKKAISGKSSEICTEEKEPELNTTSDNGSSESDETPPAASQGQEGALIPPPNPFEAPKPPVNPIQKFKDDYGSKLQKALENGPPVNPVQRAAEAEAQRLAKAEEQKRLQPNTLSAIEGNSKKICAVENDEATTLQNFQQIVGGAMVLAREDKDNESGVEYQFFYRGWYVDMSDIKNTRTYLIFKWKRNRRIKYAYEVGSLGEVDDKVQFKKVKIQEGRVKILESYHTKEFYLTEQGHTAIREYNSFPQEEQYVVMV